MTEGNNIFPNQLSYRLEPTFKTNIFCMFFMVQNALPYLKKNAAAVKTASDLVY